MQTIRFPGSLARALRGRRYSITGGPMMLPYYSDACSGCSDCKKIGGQLNWEGQDPEAPAGAGSSAAAYAVAKPGNTITLVDGFDIPETDSLTAVCLNIFDDAGNSYTAEITEPGGSIELTTETTGLDFSGPLQFDVTVKTANCPDGAPFSFVLTPPITLPILSDGDPVECSEEMTVLFEGLQYSGSLEDIAAAISKLDNYTVLAGEDCQLIFCEFPGDVPPSSPEIAEAVVNLDKVATVEKYEVGVPFDFKLTVENTGNIPATGIEVDDLIAAPALLISGTGPGAYNLSSGIWTPPDLAPGQTLTLCLTVRIDEITDYQNAAAVTGDNFDDDRANLTISAEPCDKCEKTKVCDNNTVAGQPALPFSATGLAPIINGQPGGLDVVNNLAIGYWHRTSAGVILLKKDVNYIITAIKYCGQLCAVNLPFVAGKYGSTGLPEAMTAWLAASGRPEAFAFGGYPNPRFQAIPGQSGGLYSYFYSGPLNCEDCGVEEIHVKAVNLKDETADVGDGIFKFADVTVERCQDSPAVNAKEFTCPDGGDGGGDDSLSLVDENGEKLEGCDGVYTVDLTYYDGMSFTGTMQEIAAAISDLPGYTCKFNPKTCTIDFSESKKDPADLVVTCSIAVSFTVLDDMASLEISGIGLPGSQTAWTLYGNVTPDTFPAVPALGGSGPSDIGLILTGQPGGSNVADFFNVVVTNENTGCTFDLWIYLPTTTEIDENFAVVWQLAGSSVWSPVD